MQPLSGISIAMFALFATLGQLSGVEIIAHRGASHEAPENTLAAVKRAWEEGADSVEVDIHLSKDGQIVVMHDATTERTSGVCGAIAEMSVSELRALDVGLWKGAVFAKERVPLLDEVLALTPAGKRLYIEVKCGREIVPELLCALERNSGGGKVSMISFDWDLLRELKEKVPRYEVLWIRGYDANIGIEEAYREFIKKCKEAHLDGVDLSYQWPLDGKWMEEFHRAGLAVLTWTVDDPEVAARLIALGVRGITTNRPQWLRGELRKREAPAGAATY